MQLRLPKIEIRNGEEVKLLVTQEFRILGEPETTLVPAPTDPTKRPVSIDYTVAYSIIQAALNVSMQDFSHCPRKIQTAIMQLRQAIGEPGIVPLSDLLHFEDK